MMYNNAELSERDTEFLECWDNPAHVQTACTRPPRGRPGNEARGQLPHLCFGIIKKLSMDKMVAKIFPALFVLLCASNAAGGIYRFPPVILDTPEDSVCPADSQLESVRRNISENLSNILTKIAAI